MVYIFFLLFFKLDGVLSEFKLVNVEISHFDGTLGRAIG